MNLKKFSKNAVLASIATVLFASCAKNNDEHVYTPEESKAIVQATVDNFYDCMKKLNDGGFADFFYNAFFKKTVNNKGKNQSWSAYLSEKFDAILGKLVAYLQRKEIFVTYKLSCIYKINLLFSLLSFHNLL